MSDKKFQVKIELNGIHNANDTKFTILDADGNIIDKEPYFKTIDLSLRVDEPVTLKAELYGDHMILESLITVGTLAAFSLEELQNELERRRLAKCK